MIRQTYHWVSLFIRMHGRSIVFGSCRPILCSMVFWQVVLFCFASGATAQEKQVDLLERDPETFSRNLKSFTNRFCIDCHQGPGSEGEFDIEGILKRDDFRKDYTLWTKLIQKVRGKSMPPSDSEQPEEELRLRTMSELEQRLEDFFCGQDYLPPTGFLRRLNRTEYANTIRDLLGISIDVSKELPEDGAGGEGFDNAAETLFISPIHAEKYLAAASRAIDHAMKDPRSRRILLGREISKNEKPLDYGKVVLDRFLPRAFRRPALDTERKKFYRLFKIGLERSGAASAQWCTVQLERALPEERS